MVNVSSDVDKAGNPVRGHRHQENKSNIRPRAPRAKLARTSTDLELVSRIGIDEKRAKASYARDSASPKPILATECAFVKEGCSFSSNKT
jgi:hypothetical protein